MRCLLVACAGLALFAATGAARAKIAHAIHGTDSEGHLGSPVSHGCVRLSRANATTLYDMVEKDGVLNTTVTLTGSSQIALARHPRSRTNTAVARREPGDQYAPQY